MSLFPARSSSEFVFSQIRGRPRSVTASSSLGIAKPRPSVLDHAHLHYVPAFTKIAYKDSNNDSCAGKGVATRFLLSHNRSESHSLWWSMIQECFVNRVFWKRYLWRIRVSPCFYGQSMLISPMSAAECESGCQVANRLWNLSTLLPQTMDIGTCYIYVHGTQPYPNPSPTTNLTPRPLLNQSPFLTALPPPGISPSPRSH